MILIVGASGRLGSALTQRLLAQGKQVRAMTRNPLALAYLEKQGAEVIAGDLLDPASLSSACQGVDQVVAAAHGLNGKGENNLHTLDDLGNRRLIDAAETAGVKHFIFLSILGASPWAELEFFRIKFGVEEYLRTRRLKYTILRPAAFMDLWGEIVGLPILKGGKATIFGRGDNPINFVAVEDVANLVCSVLENPRALDTCIEIGGPENLTLNQVVQIFESLAGHPAKKRYVPLPVMQAMSLLMQFVNPTLNRLIQMSVFMDTQDLRFDMDGTLQEFPLTLTRFEDWSRRHYESQTGQ